MHPNEELLSKFYTCFQQRDYVGMAECYHPDIEFSDSVFLALKGKRAIAMWRMLSERAKDLDLTYRDIQADDLSGKAHWDAKYTYSATGRLVLNRIDAQFRFQDGKIIAHQDTFDLWKWAAQALGIRGQLLGWTPFVQKAIQRQAQRTLDTYMVSKGL